VDDLVFFHWSKRDLAETPSHKLQNLFIAFEPEPFSFPIASTYLARIYSLFAEMVVKVSFAPKCLLGGAVAHFKGIG
jgi:hypothetical protein